MSKLFREKSLERIASPEQLNAYIRVSTPSVWLLLAAVVILLAGVCVWGVFGRMDTTLTAVAVAEDGIVTAYLKEVDAASVRAENNVTVAGGHAKVKSVETQPMCVDDSFTDYMRHVGGLQAGEWVYAAQLEADLPDGVYAAKIVIDSVSPMSFVLN